MQIETVVDEKGLQIIRLELSSFATNAYIILCTETNKSILVDVPPGAPTLLKAVRDTDLQLILLTHSHIDHYAGLEAFRAHLNVPYAVHPKDNQTWLPFPPEIFVRNGAVFKAGKVRLEAIYTPGHTPGSTCYRVGDYLIAGDTVFPGGPGRTVSPGAFRTVVRSFQQKILPLPDDMKAFPGHGDATVLGKEKRAFAAFIARPHDPKLYGDVLWLTS